MLALGLPETAVTAAMEPQGRADALRELVGKLLERAAARQPLLVVVDDAQWLDSASWSLLAAAVLRAPSVLFVAALRPLSEPLPAGLRQLLDGAVPRLAPAPLHAGRHAAAGVRYGSACASLPRAAEALIVERAQGNPFFSEQLALALRDAGHLVVESGHCRLARPDADLGTLAVPDTVQGVVTGRIDRLGGDEQLTLKVAAVIGRVLRRALARRRAPGRAARRPDSAASCATCSRWTSRAPTRPSPKPTHLFTHAITQQVAYELMIYAQRRQMHRAIAAWFEQHFAARSTRTCRCWRTIGLRPVSRARRCPISSARRHRRWSASPTTRCCASSAEALVLVEQGRLDIEPARRARWSWYQGEALLKLARYAESREHFVDALRRLGHAVPAFARRVSWLRLVAQTIVQWGHRRRRSARGPRHRARGPAAGRAPAPAAGRSRLLGARHADAAAQRGRPR